jgi:hypothetical protein
MLTTKRDLGAVDLVRPDQRASREQKVPAVAPDERNKNERSFK